MKTCTCGKSLSDSANTCPNCGRRFTPWQVWVFGLGLPILGLCIIIGTCANMADNSTGDSSTYQNDQRRARGERNVGLSPDQAAQADSMEWCNMYVQQLTPDFVIRDLDHNRVLVGRSFLTMSYENQRYNAGMFVCDRPGMKRYTLIDKKTGRKVGEFKDGGIIFTRPTQQKEAQ